MQQYLDRAKEVASKAGAVIRAAYHDRSLRGESEFKSSAADIVTATDKAVEKLVFSELRSSFPDHRFIGEESYGDEPTVLTDALTWVVDPVDGTTNFVHGFPFVAVSIALLKSKQPIVGVVYNPIMEEMFYAAKGLGSFMNSQRLPLHPPSLPTNFETALLSTEYGYERDQRLDSKLDTIGTVLRSPARSIRSCGSAALEVCYVARGTFDAYWEAGVHMWDVAAGAIVLRETGGVMVNYFKAETSTLNPQDEVLDLSDRRFVAIKSFGADKVELQTQFLNLVRSHLRPLIYTRD